MWYYTPARTGSLIPQPSAPDDGRADGPGHAHGPVPRCKGPGAESGKIALQARAGSIDAWKPAAPSTHWAGQSRARGKEGPGDALAGHAAESGGGIARLGFAGLCDLWAVAWRRAQGC